MGSNRLWQCPYFVWSETGKIHCEGCVVALADKKTLRRYADAYCGDIDGWKSCTVARALNRQYEEDG